MKKTLRLVLYFVLAALALVALVHAVSGCSPVNVQVQNCQNEVRDSRGITFTGCKVDGHQDADADGELRVNIPAAEQSESPTSGTPTDPLGKRGPPPHLVRLHLLN